MVRSVTRAIELLQLIAGSATPLSLHAIATAGKLPKSTAFGILKTLVAARLLEIHPDGGNYCIGKGLAELAGMAQPPQDLCAVSGEHLQWLAAETGESVYLGLPEGYEVVIAARIDSPQPIRYTAKVGERRPLHCTSSGKLSLAYGSPEWVDGYLQRVALTAFTSRTLTGPDALRTDLARTRRRGYSFSDGEYLDDVMSFAAPVFHPESRQLAATVATAGPAYRVRKTRGAMVEATRDAAARIQAAIERARGPAAGPWDKKQAKKA